MEQLAFGTTLQSPLMPNFQHPGVLQGELTSKCIRLDPLSLERRVFGGVSGCTVPADFSGFSEWSMVFAPWFLAP